MSEDALVAAVYESLLEAGCNPGSTNKFGMHAAIVRGVRRERHAETDFIAIARKVVAEAFPDPRHPGYLDAVSWNTLIDLREAMWKLDEKGPQ